MRKSEEFYKRQHESGALVNANSKAYEEARRKHQKVLSDKKRIENIEKELSDLRGRYDNILNINNQILSILKNKEL